jgi:predicted LPLAT superfamily acyltransferase
MTELADEAQKATWLDTRERGTLLGIRAAYWLATALGRGPTRVFVRLIAAWYACFGGAVVEASRNWLTIVHQKPPTWGMVYRHFVYFAQITIDRIFLLKGKIGAFSVTTTGKHHLLEAAANKRGAILLGAHLGSFEAMRADGERIEIPLNILGHFANARMVNALFEQLNPGIAARVIHIEADSVDFIFDVQARVSAGEFVGTMGDRVGLNEKSTEVDFFGRKARFPTGPFVLASVLKCPVFLTFGLYREPNGYDLSCEPFVERLNLPRKNRDAELQAVVQRYAQRLEAYCLRAPYNWFNFYDFWQAPPTAAKPPERP